MGKTFSRIIWANDTGEHLNGTNMNRIEAGIDSADTRTVGLELGIAQPVSLNYSANVTVNATQGSLFFIIATGDLAITDIVGGSSGQSIALWVGAITNMNLTLAGSTAPIAANNWWTGRFSYVANDVWTLLNEWTFTSPTDINAVDLNGDPFPSTFTPTF